MLLESHKRALLTTETVTGIPVVQEREGYFATAIVGISLSKRQLYLIT